MKLLSILLLLPFFATAQLIVNPEKPNGKEFAIVSNQKASCIVYDGSENILVAKVANFLADDVERVTAIRPQVVNTMTGAENIILLGTVEQSSLIKQLADQKKLDISPIRGGWEKFIVQTVKNPFPGVKNALVIVGSDRRGAAFGAFTLSQAIGVSPWYWWADVPVKKHKNLLLKETRLVSHGPAVKYRGIFINDEAPAFRNWAKEKFGGTNHKVYEKVFELLLRNKANFIWPSMWLPTMFYVDDPLNAKTANDFGIVVSTSHHEPMTRAHNEWSVFNGGAWDYQKNKEKLQEFWRGGIARVTNYESMITVGMRGDGDEGMSEETSVDLLKGIIADQRKLIEEATHKPAKETPQVWAIYKEVQDYYDKGMRVPDDITVLFSDDNWGNIRYLPKAEDLNRSGGFGMYYHLDYVGAPTSYRWLNVSQIERIWEQMNITYSHGVKNLWIANVGDIKPMELPISFFFDYAWNPSSIQAKDLPAYYKNWATEQFGAKHASEIASLLALYTKYNARRTPEMLTPNTYSVENYREADRIVAEYNLLAEKSESIYHDLPAEYRDAFYQLVLSPILLSANINEMYVAAGKNKYYAERGAGAANFYAQKTKTYFDRDEELTRAFHEDLANGKWNHMMSQTHIGYTSWAHPPLNTMPAVSFVQLQKTPELGYLLEYGRKPSWGWLGVEAEWAFSEVMPVFDAVNDQNFYIDVINRGQGELQYKLQPKQNWIKLSANSGQTQYHQKIYVSIDWERAPKGNAQGEIVLSGAGKALTIKVPILNEPARTAGFVENDGYVAIEANHFIPSKTKISNMPTVVANLGRTLSSVILDSPIKFDKPQKQSPSLQYEFTLLKSGTPTVSTYVSPTQDYKKEGGLKFAIAIDDEEPQIININEGESSPDWNYPSWWTKSVGDHIKEKQSKHKPLSAGKHILKVWLLERGVVLQRFVISTKPLKPSYLGPPESKFSATEK
ncbi:glycosyl hydrolase [Pelobium manganitolerans]|uniref:Glycosyl hydrolase n=1 Tax=Pelobium manganitolerans TaxID=1842495 RepID=A0A419S2T9_9SPHI|nr:glycosyl hydrolase 115 family protein [Pelobium manganitolerans]RKD13290.1 glycosyl hydrolase [Pelobium manganitolerans]